MVHSRIKRACPLCTLALTRLLVVRPNRYPELKTDERRLNTLVKILNFFYIKPLEDGKVNIQVRGVGYSGWQWSVYPTGERECKMVRSMFR